MGGSPTPESELPNIFKTNRELLPKESTSNTQIHTTRGQGALYLYPAPRIRSGKDRFCFDLFFNLFFGGGSIHFGSVLFGSKPPCVLWPFSFFFKNTAYFSIQKTPKTPGIAWDENKKRILQNNQKHQCGGHVTIMLPSSAPNLLSRFFCLNTSYCFH